ncbi:MAG TPA: hypothetical protein VGM90_38885 [Kofleriaceae bacterium]|jgi:hypothetical protein
MVLRFVTGVIVCAIAAGCSREAKPVDFPPAATPAAGVAPANDEMAQFQRDVDAIESASARHEKAVSELALQAGENDDALAAALTDSDRSLMMTQIASAVAQLEDLRLGIASTKEAIATLLARRPVVGDRIRLDQLRKAAQENDEYLDKLLSDLAEMEKHDAGQKDIVIRAQADADRAAANAKLREFELEQEAAKKKKR